MKRKRLTEEEKQLVRGVVRDCNKLSGFNPEEYITGGDFVDSYKRPKSFIGDTHASDLEGTQDSLNDLFKDFHHCPEEITSADILNDPYLTGEEKRILLTPEDYNKLLKENRMENKKYKMDPEEKVELLIRKLKEEDERKEKVRQMEACLGDSVARSESEAERYLQQANNLRETLYQLSESIFAKCMMLSPLSDDEPKPPNHPEAKNNGGFMGELNSQLHELQKIRVKFELANQILTKIVG